MYIGESDAKKALRGDRQLDNEMRRVQSVGVCKADGKTEQRVLCVYCGLCAAALAVVWAELTDLPEVDSSRCAMPIMLRARVATTTKNRL